MLARAGNERTESMPSSTEKDITAENEPFAAVVRPAVGAMPEAREELQFYHPTMKDETRRALVKFLNLYAQTGAKTLSARASNINRSTVLYYESPRGPGYIKEFADLVAIAQEIYNDSVQTEVFRRGVQGITENVYNKNGAVVGKRTLYSDKLLELEAKRTNAAYRDKATATQVNVSLEQNIDLRTMPSHNLEQLRTLIESQEKVISSKNEQNE